MSAQVHTSAPERVPSAGLPVTNQAFEVWTSRYLWETVTSPFLKIACQQESNSTFSTLSYMGVF
jgi:hypothetical protein